MEQTTINPKLAKESTLKTFTKNLSNFIKFTTVFFVVIIISILTYTVSYFLNLDSQFFKLEFTGQVLDELNNPIKGAVVKFGSRETVTNSDGDFKFQNVPEEEVNVEIEAVGFVRKEEKVKLQKRYLDYSYSETFKLNSAIMAEISGNFKAASNHNFLNDSLFIDTDQIAIDSKGAFSAKVETGTREFIYQSEYYKDIKQTIEVLPGKNFLDEIKLIESADLLLENKDYISKQSVSNVKITATEIEPNKIKYGKDKIVVEDLNLNQKYSLRVTATGYQTRDYTFTLVKSGVNKLFEFRLVPEGEITYLQKPKEEKKFFLFSSDLDGVNETRLSESTDGIEAEQILYTQDSSVYLVSDRIDRINSSLKGRTKLLYKAGDNGALELTLKDTSELGNLYFFPDQKKILNFTNIGSSRTPSYKLELMNLEGTGRSTVFTFENAVAEDLLLSSNGSQIYTKEIDSNKQYLIRNIDVSTKKSTVLLDKQKEISLHDVSADGNKLIYSAFDTSSTFTNLVMRDISRAEKRTLITNNLGRYYQFAKGSSNEIVFFEKINNRETAFRYLIEQNKKEELFKLNSGETVSKLIKYKDWLIYLIEGKGMYIFDLISPASYVKVVEGEVKI